MKPTALFFLGADALASAFGPEEIRDLQRLVELPFPPLVPGRFHGESRFEAVEILITGWETPPLTVDLLNSFPKLKLICHAAGSVKSLATKEVWHREIRVCSAARVNAVPVAEYCLSQIIFCLKHGWQRAREIQGSRLYRKEDPSVPLPSAFGSTVGLLSFGHTGRILRELLHNLDVEVLVYDPYLSVEEARRVNVSLLSLDEVFECSDIVSCHTPQLEETIGMIRGTHFEKMKLGASFLNTARGRVVNEAEMIDVLKRRTDICAVLDVTENEPPLSDSSLYTLPNVILTPHIAGSLGPECRRMGRMAIDDIARFLAGSELVGEVSSPSLPYLA